MGWNPDIDGRGGPKYLAIAEAIGRDVEAGRLRPGDRLPPQRALALSLGVDLTTVTRAYAEAQRQGLIDGDGRRGSFVRQDRKAKHAHSEPVDVGMNAPPEPPGDVLGLAYHQAVKGLHEAGTLSGLFHYQPRGGMPSVRAAGVKLLSLRQIPCSEDTVIVAAGGQHALHAVMNNALRADDAIGVGSFAYPGFLALARRSGLRLVTVASDAQGIDPGALEEACTVHRLRALYVVPTNDNPTTATLSAQRREAIARVAERHALLIIEDDAYGFLPEHPLPPLAALLPQRTWHIASVSKVLGPGLRVAFVRAPDIAGAWGLTADLHETAIMAPPVNAAIVSAWIEDGTFDILRRAVRDEAMARQALARAVLAPDAFRAQPEGYHLWLPLPGTAKVDDIINAVRPLGLSAIAGDAFAVVPEASTAALRVSIGGVISRDRLERALGLLAVLMGPDAMREAAVV